MPRIDVYSAGDGRCIESFMSAEVVNCIAGGQGDLDYTLIHHGDEAVEIFGPVIVISHKKREEE